VGDHRVPVEHLDVLEGDPEPVRDDLGERRLVALTVGRGTGEHLDLAGRQHPHARVLPAAGAVVQRAEHPGGSQPAHLGERRDADAELDPVAGGAACHLLGAQLVVAEHRLGVRRGGLVVAGVVLEPRNGGEGELLGLDPVHLTDHERVDLQLRGQLVHHPLDAVRRLGPTGTAVGVGPGLVGQHRLTGELVGGELVDRVEHERTEHRHASAHQRDVRAHVGQELDLEPGDPAVLLGRQGELLPLVATVVGGHQRLRAGLGVLDRLPEAPGQQEGDELLRGGLELAAEAAADVGGDHPDLGLRDAGHRGQQELQDVRDLGGRPHGDLLTGRVDDGRAGLHEGGNQALLAVLALDDDAVGAGLGDGVVDVPAGACVRGVELPER